MANPPTNRVESRWPHASSDGHESTLPGVKEVADKLESTIERLGQAIGDYPRTSTLAAATLGVLLGWLMKTQVNSNGRASGDAPDVAESFADLAHDAIELAELQAQLLKLDARIAARNGGTSLALGVVGVCLLLGCVPVALVALAEVFAARFGWSRAAALGAAAAIGFAMSAAAGAIAWYRLRAGLGALERSRDELRRNLSWLKANLRRGRGQSASDR